MKPKNVIDCDYKKENILKKYKLQPLQNLKRKLFILKTLITKEIHQKKF